MFKVKDEIFWIGIKNWELETFHGAEFTTPHGSSYNAYLIKDEKVALIDTVWQPFKEEFIQRLDKEIGLENIDYIIMNHSEIDHAGSLASLMHRIPHVPIYCTQKGKDILYKMFQKDWNFKIVKTGDTLSLGKNELLFVEAPMLHWPDSMFTYVKGANVLLSNDAFGQHYAAAEFFSDEVDKDTLEKEALKYYVNIIQPFRRIVKQKLTQLREMDIQLDMIAPSHGIIWTNPAQILEKYQEWSTNDPNNSVVVLYDTMWGSTKKMAHAIVEGLAQENISYKLFNVAKNDNSDILVEIFKAKGIIVGSSTINNGILSSIPGLMEEIKGMKFADRIGAAFGSFGWSGEGVSAITGLLTDAKINVVLDGLKFKFNPTENELQQCVAFGREFARKMK